MEEYWVWLTLLKGIGPVTAKKLLNELGTPENIYNADYDQLIKITGIGSATANIILDSKSILIYVLIFVVNMYIINLQNKYVDQCLGVLREPGPYLY
ncbi:MAG: helix-hairpin-helix domain-containing protein [Tissierellia bacterium]|nr:helix-hairpin-helix domain-containing protein [Tissierellia bacterium]MDD4780971.1 helix-hairpin-helix domain-containing protein [Tissierellia bacterium]